MVYELAFKRFLEHQSKHIGSVFGGVLGIIGGLLLLFIDYYVDFIIVEKEIEIFTRLVSIINMLISIVIGISVTSFSVIFVVKQLASSQFSPRILRHFLVNDIKIQFYISFFITSIALGILPQLAYSFFPENSFLMSLCIGVLHLMVAMFWLYPRMIMYLSANMNVTAITNKIKLDVQAEVELLYKENWKKGMPLYYKRKAIDSEHNIRIISRLKSGYLETIDFSRLKKLLSRNKILQNYIGQFEIYQKPLIGRYITQNATTLVIVNFDSIFEKTNANIITNEVNKIVHQAFKVQTFRSQNLDVLFGVRKLVDIAIKAISPAVNDPTTCLNCLDQIGEIVLILSKKKYPSSLSYNMDKLHYHVNEFDYEESIDMCFDQIFHWGKEDPTIVKKIVSVINNILPHIDNPFHLNVLIREIEDMNLENLYNLNNFELGHLKCSKEKLFSVQKMYTKFKKTATSQITKLNEQGILDFYENNYFDFPELQKACIKHLKTYGK